MGAEDHLGRTEEARRSAQIEDHGYLPEEQMHALCMLIFKDAQKRGISFSKILVYEPWVAEIVRTFEVQNNAKVPLRKLQERIIKSLAP